MSDDFSEIGFTLEEEDAFWEELKKVGLKPGVNEQKTRFEIVTYLVDLHDNPPEAVRAKVVGQRLTTMRRDWKPSCTRMLRMTQRVRSSSCTWPIKG